MTVLLKAFFPVLSAIMFSAYWPLTTAFSAPRGTLLTAGAWGGRHIYMEVTPEQTKVEYDCAHGIISSKILLDTRGRFAVRGTHFEERGGPVRQGGETKGYAVQFKGSVKGKIMKLSVTRPDTGELIGSFTLTLGHEPALVKCR